MGCVTGTQGVPGEGDCRRRDSCGVLELQSRWWEVGFEGGISEDEHGRVPLL